MTAPRTDSIGDRALTYIRANGPSSDVVLADSLDADLTAVQNTMRYLERQDVANSKRQGGVTYWHVGAGEPRAMLPEEPLTDRRPRKVVPVPDVAAILAPAPPPAPAPKQRYPVRELTGRLLDRAVALACDQPAEERAWPITDLSYSMPLVFEANIGLVYGGPNADGVGTWLAFMVLVNDGEVETDYGRTKLTKTIDCMSTIPIEAAMRVLVESRLGAEVEL